MIIFLLFSGWANLVTGHLWVNTINTLSRWMLSDHRNNLEVGSYLSRSKKGKKDYYLRTLLFFYPEVTQQTRSFGPFSVKYVSVCSKWPSEQGPQTHITYQLNLVVQAWCLVRQGGVEEEEGGVPQTIVTKQLRNKESMPCQPKQDSFPSQYKWPAISPQPEAYREPTEEPE